jgi:hypothetical protein
VASASLVVFQLRLTTCGHACGDVDDPGVPSR